MCPFLLLTYRFSYLCNIDIQLFIWLQITEITLCYWCCLFAHFQESSIELQWISKYHTVTVNACRGRPFYLKSHFPSVTSFPSFNYMELQFLLNFHLSPGCRMITHAECCSDQKNVLVEGIDGSVFKLGNWPSHESAEKYLLCFYCSEKLFMNSSHFLSQKPPQPHVFITAVDGGLARGHPWCSSGCWGKPGIRKLPVTGHRKQLCSMAPISFMNLAPDWQCCKCCVLQDAGDRNKFFQILTALWLVLSVLKDSLVRLAHTNTSGWNFLEINKQIDSSWSICSDGSLSESRPQRDGQANENNFHSKMIRAADPALQEISAEQSLFF